MYSKKIDKLKAINTSHSCKEPFANYPHIKNDIFFEQIEPYIYLLQRLNKQSKWQLWLLNNLNISINFIESIGLNSNKIILLPHILAQHHETIIQQALFNDNFSCILSNYPFNICAFDLKNHYKTIIFQLGSSQLKRKKQKMILTH